MKMLHCFIFWGWAGPPGLGCRAQRPGRTPGPWPCSVGVVAGAHGAAGLFVSLHTPTTAMALPILMQPLVPRAPASQADPMFYIRGATEDTKRALQGAPAVRAVPAALPRRMLRPRRMGRRGPPSPGCLLCCLSSGCL